MTIDNAFTATNAPIIRHPLDELGDEPPSFTATNAPIIRHPLDELGDEPPSFTATNAPIIRHPLDELGDEPPSYGFLLSSGFITSPTQEPLTLDTTPERNYLSPPPFPFPFDENQDFPFPFNHQDRPSLEREELKLLAQKISTGLQILFVFLLIFFLSFALILSLVGIFTKYLTALKTAFGICGVAALASFIAVPVIQKKCRIED